MSAWGYRRPDAAQKELEAESVAYLVCRRRGVEPHLQPYCRILRSPKPQSAVNRADVYQVMRVAGQVEGLPGLSSIQKLPSRSQSGNQVLDL